MPTTIIKNDKLQKFIATTTIGAALIFMTSVVPSQAQPRPPIGNNSRIPGLGSLGTYPDLNKENLRQSGRNYLARLCYRFGSEYGRLLRAQTNDDGSIVCDMERASFVISERQRFGG
jgi:hypothetical protein